MKRYDFASDYGYSTYEDIEGAWVSYDDHAAEVARLADALKNGITWNENENRFDVVWTKEEIEVAQDSAQELAEVMGIKPEPTRQELKAALARVEAERDELREKLGRAEAAHSGCWLATTHGAECPAHAVVLNENKW